MASKYKIYKPYKGVVIVRWEDGTYRANMYSPTPTLQSMKNQINRDIEAHRPKKKKTYPKRKAR